MEEVISGVAMPLALVIIAVLFMILFRDKLETIEIDPVKRKIKLKIHQKLKDAERSAKGITASVVESRSLSGTQPAQNYSTSKARDIVLGAWGRLKQILYDACSAKNMPLTPSTSPLEASARLYEADWISTEVRDLVHVLYELAQELDADTTIRPYPKDARTYAELADVVLSWMMLYVLPEKNAARTVVKNKTAAKNVGDIRRTVVSRDFRPPGPGHPTALLIGIGGPVRGQRYAIEATQVQIGADDGNDLLIRNDEYVSANHAVLRYEQGDLFLVDQDSRNGTFLNDNQVTSSALLVHPGDRIKFGESVFQVSATGGSSATKETPAASNQPQVR